MKARVVERGVYLAEPSRPAVASHDTYHNLEDPRLLSDTALIVGKVGAIWGIRYVIDGESPGERISVRVRVTFPKSELKDPDRNKTVYEIEFSASSEVGMLTFSGYRFNNEWEVVPGIWTIELWIDGSRLAEQQFCVTKFDDLRLMPALGRDCSGMFGK